MKPRRKFDRTCHAGGRVLDEGYMRPGWQEASCPAKLFHVSDSTFFSDRAGQPVPRVSEEITTNVWRGLVALIESRLGDGSLARDFAMRDCEDGESYITGTDEDRFLDSLRALVPQAGSRPLNPNRLPGVAVILDILDFVALHIDEPASRTFHSYFGHQHLFFGPQWKVLCYARRDKVPERRGPNFRPKWYRIYLWR